MPDQSENAEVRAAEQQLQAIPEYDWIARSGQQWFTVSEVATAMAVGKEAVRGWCERGLIAGAVMYGQQIGWRMPRSGLLLYLADLVRSGGRGRADGTNGQH